MCIQRVVNLQYPVRKPILTQNLRHGFQTLYYAANRLVHVAGKKPVGYSSCLCVCSSFETRAKGMAGQHNSKIFLSRARGLNSASTRQLPIFQQKKKRICRLLGLLIGIYIFSLIFIVCSFWLTAFFCVYCRLLCYIFYIVLFVTMIVLLN